MSSKEVDETIEPQPLWEYPCTASGDPVSLLTVDFTQKVDQTSLVNQKLTLNVIG